MRFFYFIKFIHLVKFKHSFFILLDLPFHNIPLNGHTNSILLRGGEIWDGVDSSSWLFRFLCFCFSCHSIRMQHLAKDGSLIPMGHSIGIKMDLSGVFITNDVMIGKDNWLKAGDLIGQVDRCDQSNT